GACGQGRSGTRVRPDEVCGVRARDGNVGNSRTYRANIRDGDCGRRRVRGADQGAAERHVQGAWAQNRSETIAAQEDELADAGGLGDPDGSGQGADGVRCEYYSDVAISPAAP